MWLSRLEDWERKGLHGGDADNLDEDNNHGPDEADGGYNLNKASHFHCLGSRHNHYSFTSSVEQSPAKAAGEAGHYIGQVVCM